MTSPDDFGQMPTGDFSRLEGLCEQLEHAWKEFDGSADGVDLETLLPPQSDGLRLAALYELIKTEMPLRLENGLPWDLDFYLPKFPELGGAENLSANLILEECLVRKKHGMRVSATNYSKRFPRQFPEVEKQLTKLDSSPVAPIPSPVASPAAPLEAMSPLFGIAVGRTVANHFVVQKRLGGGAYGEVWKVLDTNGGIEKALKIIMHSMDTEEAKTELQALEKIKNLESPFILRTDSFWVEEGRLLIIMELARGGSLRDCLKRRKSEGHTGIPAAELLRYTREAADALDYLHGEKIVHRDIKPDNILLVGNHAKIADMGLAKLMSSDRSTTTSPLGSAPYMAPEVWNERVSSRSDQYSLVVSYAELRQGKLPFKGNKITDFFMAHVSGTAVLEAGVMLEAEQQVIRKGLSKDPAQRFISCGEFFEALESAVPGRRERKAVPAAAPREPDAKKLAPSTPAPSVAAPAEARPAPPRAVPLAPPVPAVPAAAEQAGSVMVAVEAATAFHSVEVLKEEAAKAAESMVLKTETPRDTSAAREKEAQDALAQARQQVAEQAPKRATPPDGAAPPQGPPEPSSWGTITPKAAGSLPKAPRDKKPADTSKPPAPKPVQPEAAKPAAPKPEPPAIVSAVRVPRPPSPPAPAQPPASEPESGAFISKLQVGFKLRNLELRKWLGRGAFADVWKVLDREGGVEKAIRIITASRLSEEAQGEMKAFEAYRNLSHPFLLRTESLFVEQNRLVIVMELMEGGSLKDRLKEYQAVGEKGIKPASPWLDYIKEVAQALDYLHGKNVLHRDIKPANILLNKEKDHVKVADLGVAKLTQKDADKATLAGTKEFIAPEIWNEQGCFPASDQYSLAAMYADMRQGQTASRMGNPCLLRQVFGQEELKVIDKALNKDPGQRYSSCVEFVTVLEKAVRTDGVDGGRRQVEVKRAKTSEVKHEQLKSKVEPRRESIWPRRIAAAGVLAILTGIVVFALMMIRPDPNTDKNSNPADAAKKDVAGNGDAPVKVKPPLDRVPAPDGVNHNIVPSEDLVAKEIAGLLQRSEREPLRAALTTLKEAETLARRHAQPGDFVARINTKRNERVEQGRAKLWKAATEAVEKNTLDARKRLTELEETDSWLATDFSVPFPPPDPRAKPLWTKYIKNVVPKWPAAGGWRERLADCRKADPENLWVQACARECLLEDESLRKDYGKEFTRNLSDANTYAQYVRGLAEPDANDAAARLKALSATREDWFAVNERRAKAAHILQAAAKKQRAPDAFYATDAQARTAYEYLDLAAKWLNAPSGFNAADWARLREDAKVELAMAALSKPNFQWDVGTSTAAKLLKTPDKLGGLERKFLRLVTAPSYREILSDIKNSRLKDTGQFPFADWQSLLEHALSLREAGVDNAEAARQSARWLAAKGWLYRVHQDGTLDKKRDFGTAAFNAYNEAYQSASAANTALAKTEQAEFLSRRILAEAYAIGLEKVTPDRWMQLEVEADRAASQVTGDAGNPNARGARALVLLQQARHERKLEARRTKFKAAYDDLREALRLTQGDKDEDWAFYSFLQSAVCVHRADLETRPAQQKDYIEEAERMAAAVAEQRLAFPTRGSVYLAYGNALEDVQMLVKKQQANYSKAAEIFGAGLDIENSALGEQGNQPKLLVALGRCHYRWAEAGEKKEHLKKAEEFLRRALAVEDQFWVGAEAHYWLGVIHQTNNDGGEAKAAFEHSVKLGQEHGNVAWVLMSKAALCTLAIVQAGVDYGEGVKTKDQARFESCLASVAEAQKLVDAVKGDYLDGLHIHSDRMTRSLATLGGSAHYMLKDYGAAAVQYDKGLGNLEAIVVEDVTLFNLKIASLRAGKDFAKQNDAAMKKAVLQATKLAAWLQDHAEIDQKIRTRFETTAGGIHTELAAAIGQGQFQDLRRAVDQLGSALKKLKAE